jgi:hypothetical protein
MSRCFATRMALGLLLGLLSVWTGCQSGPTGVEERRFACAEDSECASGFVCREQECRPGEPPDAGPDSGTPDGGPDPGTPDGGDPSQPTVLAFANSQPPLVVGQCSDAVVVETRSSTGAVAPVSAATAITLSTNPSTGVASYRDGNCQTPTALVTVEPGSSRATFHVRGTVAQEVQLGAIASGFSNANQALTLRAAAPSSLAFVSASQTLPTGGCSARVDLEARDTYGNASPFPSPRTVTLRTQAGGALVFFSDSKCETVITETVFATGTARASFYFEGRTGGASTLSATLQGLAQATQKASILPIVRTGYCSFSSTSRTAQCDPISPAQLDPTKTMLFFQSVSDDANPSASSVRCVLTSREALTCTRSDSGSSVDLIWHTVEKAAGLQVQHLTTACRDGAPLASISVRPVNPDSTFLLVSAEQGGTTLGDDDFFTARLAAADQVELAFSTRCSNAWKASVQVVEAPGSHITRGLTGKMTGTQLTVSGLPAVDLSSTALLFTHRVSNTEAPVLCDRVLRGELTSPTSLTFSRGAGNTACTAASIDAISWERIEFGALARTQHTLVTLSPSTEEADLVIEPVDRTRSLIFASAQSIAGQGGGESSYSGNDLLGASLGWHEIYADTEFNVSRAAPAGTVKWSSTVVEFEP